jgi:integrase
MKKFDKILKDYLEYKKTSVNSKDKLICLRNYVGKFLKFIKDIDKCQEKDLVRFVNNCSKKYGVSTMNDIKVFLKNFIKWYFVDWSSRFRNLDKICKNEKPPKKYNSNDMLSKEEVEKLIQEEPTNFWKAYFSVLFYGGMRPSEVCNLKWKDIDFDTKHGDAFITIYSKKNKESFEKNVPENVVFYLNKLKDNNSEWVFPSPKVNKKKGLPITQKSVYTRLIPLSQKALGKKVNPYRLRHSIATLQYIRNDIKDDIVAKHMGHSKSMKHIYTNLSREQLREQARKIWIEPKDLPPEKKHKLEQEIEKIKKENKIMFTAIKKRVKEDKELNHKENLLLSELEKQTQEQREQINLLMKKVPELRKLAKTRIKT